MKKIVLKVIIICSRCKACVVKTVAKIDGIISISVDVEKSTVTIIGQVDAACIVKELRKAGKSVEIESVGEHKKEEKKDEKKKDDDKKKKCKEECKKKCKEECKKECKEECKPLPPCCNACKQAPYGNIVWYEQSNVCTIL
ncbi:heavy metal-associated isoprenylated plant protein 44-like [Phoenix dactylifera]|uniref:Heavy metal-associated isoprenylated plant protein 44-like n=1 Tax=Phoenix dactylifera TaxID=42345 RepID=A0A8B7MVJ8_PHODC|nr:heavy metal-associated isoprenylated plant protein 44-like [Phoenix dactylifera]